MAGFLGLDEVQVPRAYSVKAVATLLIFIWDVVVGLPGVWGPGRLSSSLMLDL